MTKDWTKEEIEILRARRAERIPVPLIAKELGRPVPATYARARIIGSKVMERRPWDDAEVARLVDLDERRVPIAAIAAELDRPETSIRWKLDDIGRGGNRVKRWTAAEVRRLGRVLADGGDLQAFAEASGRPLAAVEERAKAEGFIERRRVFWTEAGEAVLRRGIDDLEKVATDLGMPVEAVVAKAKRLGLLAVPEYPASFDAAIRAAVADGGGIAALARRTGRSARFLRDRAVAIGALRRGPARRVDETAARAIVEAARAGEGVTAAAERLGRDVRTLKAVASEAGAEFAPVRRERPAAVRTVAPKPFRFGGRRGATAAAPAENAAAVTAFLAVREVTRAPTAGSDGLVLGLRRRGYSVTGTDGSGWTVDGRTRLASVEALEAFALARGIGA